MVRNESFSPSDICICVRFDKYSTINRSCRGEGGEEEIEREEGGGRERELQYGLSGYHVPSG